MSPLSWPNVFIHFHERIRNILVKSGTAGWMQLMYWGSPQPLILPILAGKISSLALILNINFSRVFCQVKLTNEGKQKWSLPNKD